MELYEFGEFNREHFTFHTHTVFSLLLAFVSHLKHQAQKTSRMHYYLKIFWNGMQPLFEIQFNQWQNSHRWIDEAFKLAPCTVFFFVLQYMHFWLVGWALPFKWKSAKKANPQIWGNILFIEKVSENKFNWKLCTLKEQQLAFFLWIRIPVF